MLPAKSQKPGEESVVWNLPLYNTVHNILTNPVYAGAYAFGRTTSKTVKCGHCGRKMYVGYGRSGRYYCQGANVNHGTDRCISFGGLKVDQAVGSEVLRALKPLGVDAAAKALDVETRETSAAPVITSWHSSASATRWRTHAGNMTRWIQPIALSPVNWNGAGMQLSRRHIASSRRSPSSTRRNACR